MKKYQIFSANKDLTDENYHLYEHIANENNESVVDIVINPFYKQIIDIQEKNYDFILTDILPNNKKLTNLPHIKKILIDKGIIIKHCCNCSINLCLFENNFWDKQKSIIKEKFNPTFVNNENLEILKKTNYIYVTKHDYDFLPKLINRVNVNCKLILELDNNSSCEIIDIASIIDTKFIKEETSLREKFKHLISTQNKFPKNNTSTPSEKDVNKITKIALKDIFSFDERIDIATLITDKECTNTATTNTEYQLAKIREHLESIYIRKSALDICNILSNENIFKGFVSDHPIIDFKRYDSELKFFIYYLIFSDEVINESLLNKRYTIKIFEMIHHKSTTKYSDLVNYFKSGKTSKIVLAQHCKMFFYNSRLDYTPIELQRYLLFNNITIHKIIENKSTLTDLPIFKKIKFNFENGNFNINYPFLELCIYFSGFKIDYSKQSSLTLKIMHFLHNQNDNNLLLEIFNYFDFKKELRITEKIIYTILFPENSNKKTQYDDQELIDLISKNYTFAEKRNHWMKFFPIPIAFMKKILAHTHNNSILHYFNHSLILSECDGKSVDYFYELLSDLFNNRL